MLDFLSQYWGSILVALIVLGLCVLAIWRLHAHRKKGECGCGSSCGNCGNCGSCCGCPNSGSCHRKTNKT